MAKIFGQKIKRRKLLVIFFFAFLLRFVLLFFPFHGDVLSNMDWGIRFWEYGPKRFYQANVWNFVWPNQPPGTIYLFALIRKLYQAIYQFFWQINLSIPLFPSDLMFFIEDRLYPALLKLPSSLADLGIGYLVYWFVKKRKSKRLAFRTLILWLFNPITFYNSSIWGQTEAWVTFFGLLGIFLLIEQKPILGSLSYVLSLYFKASMLIFTPIIAFILFKQRYSWQKYLLSIFIPLAIILILTLPFVDKGNPVVWLFNLYKDKVFGWQLRHLTANAFNFWALTFGLDPKPDNVFFGPITYRVWGIIFFGLALIILLYFLYQKQTAERIIFISFLTAFSSFMLLTSIHERYLFPAFPFLVILTAFYPQTLWSYLALSGIHLANLYNFWWYPRIELLVELFTARGKMIPWFFALSNIILFLLSWRFFFTLFGRQVKIKWKWRKK